LLLVRASGTRPQVPAPDLDLEALRRRFHSLHSTLRDAGLNPLEAVSLLASAIAPNGNAPDSRLTPEIQTALEDTARGATAGDLSVGFQQYIASEARNGLGQYLTPLPVADLIANLVSQSRPRSVLDPFAGSGLLLERVGERLNGNTLIGIEINPAVAQLAQAIGRLSRQRIDVANDDAFVRWSHGELPSVDAVVTNPPFGSVATRADREGLRRVGASPALLALSVLPAELLGLELSVAALREDGSLAIVLPQSVLTNASWADYRADLFCRIRLNAVVSLAEETFAPFRGVAKACVLFATKSTTELPISVPYIRSRAIGYDDTGRPNGPSDMEAVEAQVLSGASPLATITATGQVLIPAGSKRAEGEHSCQLGEVADIFSGRTLARSDYVDRGPRLLKVGDLAGSFIPWRNRKRTHIPQAVYDKNIRARLQRLDVCLTSAAHRPRYIGLKVDLIDELPSEGAMASAEVLVIRVHDDAIVTPEDVLFYLRSPGGYEQLQDRIRGSTAHLYPQDVTSVVIPLPDAVRSRRARQAFWAASRSFRDYLRHESEALEYGTGGEVVEVDEPEP
jgi:type I restriction enzyme M protein